MRSRTKFFQCVQKGIRSKGSSNLLIRAIYGMVVWLDRRIRNLPENYSIFMNSLYKADKMADEKEGKAVSNEACFYFPLSFHFLISPLSDDRVDLNYARWFPIQVTLKEHGILINNTVY